MNTVKAADVRNNSEKVLVFPAELLGLFPPIENGISLEPLVTGNIIFNNPGLTFVDRQDAETDPNWKQIIPYMLVKFQDTYLVYQRTKHGGEGRLHNLYSIGLGGHVKDSDGVGPIEAYVNGMTRELKEEIDIDIVSDPVAVKACLYEPSTPVGSVHFGFVYVIEASSPKAVAKDPTIGIPSFMAVPFIKSMRDKFETWSQIVIDNLI